MLEEILNVDQGRVVNIQIAASPTASSHTAENDPPQAPIWERNASEIALDIALLWVIDADCRYATSHTPRALHLTESALAAWTEGDATCFK
jgi:hypothetical protein